MELLEIVEKANAKFNQEMAIRWIKASPQLNPGLCYQKYRISSGKCILEYRRRNKMMLIFVISASQTKLSENMKFVDKSGV